MSRFHGLCRGCLERRYQQVGCNRGTRPPSLGSAEASEFWRAFLGEETSEPDSPWASTAFNPAEFPHPCEVGEAYSPCSVIWKSPLLISTRKSGPSECWDSD